MKAMLFEKLIDHKDRKKIRKRTRRYDPSYDFRIQFEAFPEKNSISFLVVGDSGAGDEDDLMKYHDTKQLEWLKNVLQHEDAKGKWKIVYLHHSLYSSESGHVDDTATGGLRENLRKILIDNKVNLILSGHSHCFEWVKRKAAHSTDSETEKTLANAEQNICYIVSGGGGQKLRESVLEEDCTNESSKEKQELFLGVAESLGYTAIIDELKKEGIKSSVHNYVKIEASQNSLKVIPVGVSEKEKEAYPLPEFQTKVFD